MTKINQMAITKTVVQKPQHDELMKNNNPDG